MDTPITHIIMITVTTLMATFHPIMISATFIISKVVTMRLAIGRGDTDLDFLKGHNKGRALGTLPFMVGKKSASGPMAIP
jgi:hypothetical protein